MLAPPRPPQHDELEALIREARARQRRRWVGAAALVALVAGGALAAYSIANGGSSSAYQADRGSPAVTGKEKCGIRVAGPRILGRRGKTIYREPVSNGEAHPNSIPSQVRCSASAIWVVWDNGGAMNKEAYIGARSGDAGRTWHLVFSEPFFGVKAPHALDAYLGPWTLRGPEIAYFVGSCPACSAGTLGGTVSLWVTKDGGRTFRRYRVPSLDGYGGSRMRVSGHVVTIVGQRFNVGIPPRKTVTLRVG